LSEGVLELARPHSSERALELIKLLGSLTGAKEHHNQRARGDSIKRGGQARLTRHGRGVGPPVEFIADQTSQLLFPRHGRIDAERRGKESSIMRVRFRSHSAHESKRHE